MTTKNNFDNSRNYISPREKFVPAISPNLVPLILTDAYSLLNDSSNIKIDELHGLIENSQDLHKTFIDNLELWKQFYNDRHIVIRNNILNPKLFDIVKFLLEQENGEIVECFRSEIIKQVLCSQVFLSSKIEKKQDNAQNKINELLSNLQYHDDLAEFLSRLSIQDIIEEVKICTTKMVELYTTISLITIIYENLFELEPKFVKTILEFITTKIVSLQKNEYREHIMSNKLLNQYFEKIIPLKKFMGQSLNDDELFKQIKTHQIKDKSPLIKMFKELSLDTLLDIFEHDLNNVLTFFEEVDYIDEITKQFRFVEVFLNKMLNEKNIQNY